MKFIHTSDWHLGRVLHGRKRYREFEQFLDWLLDRIQELHIDALLVAGDIFDNATPSNRALELYYRFLCRVASTCCRHVVITAGNHDSPSLLDAPRDILQFLDIHVIGGVNGLPEDEVLLLETKDGVAELIVCAVPYLRDRDIRSAEAGESLEDKSRKLLDGLKEHYRAVVREAERLNSGLNRPVPIVAMGHLFTAGGRTIDGDGVRELYVGSLSHVEPDAFPDSIDYLALGHLHVAQKVGVKESRRYSGSPLPMSFSEAGQSKSVTVVELKSDQVEVSELPVPCFQRLEIVRGDLDTIHSRIQTLKDENQEAWLEVVYDGAMIVGSNLQADLNQLVNGSRIEILRTRNHRLIEQVLQRQSREETLDDLHVDDVFHRCLVCHQVEGESYEQLMATFRETVAMIHEQDELAE